MKSNYSLSFVTLFPLYGVIHSDCLVRGFSGFSPDVFMLFGCLASVGSYGLTCFGCCKMLYSNRNGGNVRRLQYRLKWLCDADFVVSYRYKGRVRYKISSHAEKLIIKSIGKDQLRSIAQFIKASIKE